MHANIARYHQFIPRINEQCAIDIGHEILGHTLANHHFIKPCTLLSITHFIFITGTRPIERKW